MHDGRISRLERQDRCLDLGAEASNELCRRSLTELRQALLASPSRQGPEQGTVYDAKSDRVRHFWDPHRIAVANSAVLPVRAPPQVVVPSPVTLVLVAVVDEIVARELPDDEIGPEGPAIVLVEHELLQRPESVDRGGEEVDGEAAAPQPSLHAVDKNLPVRNLVRLGNRVTENADARFGVACGLFDSPHTVSIVGGDDRSVAGAFVSNDLRARREPTVARIPHAVERGAAQDHGPAVLENALQKTDSVLRRDDSE